jgi:hypothetical protein
MVLSYRGPHGQPHLMATRATMVDPNICVAAFGKSLDDREPSSRPWSGAKSKLSFCRVTQDGDREGCLYLARLPAPHEAAAIRETLGIRKRRTITDEARVQLEANLKSTKSPKLDPPVR